MNQRPPPAPWGRAPAGTTEPPPPARVGGRGGLGGKALIVSGRVDQAALALAIAEGALGSVPKSSSFETLLHTVSAAAQGRPVMAEAERQAWLARHQSHVVRERALIQRLDRLSNRERQVLELLAEGLRASAIAEKFVVSMTTVRTQIRSILAKLEVTSQLEAVVLVHQRHRW